MISQTFATDFAQNWIDAFNGHDIECIFDLYEDDFSMTSPYISERMGVEAGVLVGKEAVRPYWEKSLAARPLLTFKLIGVYWGVNSVVIHYQSIGRKMVCESFTFSPRGLVSHACSQHGVDLL